MPSDESKGSQLDAIGSLAQRQLDNTCATAPKTRGRHSRAWPFHGTAEDGELLPKSDILESQLATSLEGRDKSGNQRRNHAGMVPADRRLIKFGARG